MLSVFTQEEEEKIKKMKVLDRVIFVEKIQEERKDIVDENKKFQAVEDEWVKQGCVIDSRFA